MERIKLYGLISTSKHEIKKKKSDDSNVEGKQQKKYLSVLSSKTPLQKLCGVFTSRSVIP